MSDDLVKVAVSEGKYTFGQRKDGSCYALRHGEPWREGIFDGMTLAMAYRIEELEAKLAKAVAAGVRVRNYYENHGSNDVYAVSDFNAVIGELKGPKDE